MPSPIVVNLNAAEQARLREQRRRLRLLCPLLRLRILYSLLKSARPRKLPIGLLCSRSSVYEVIRACWQGWRPGRIEELEQVSSALALIPSLRRDLLTFSEVAHC